METGVCQGRLRELDLFAQVLDATDLGGSAQVPEAQFVDGDLFPLDFGSGTCQQGRREMAREAGPGRSDRWRRHESLRVPGQA